MTRDSENVHSDRLPTPAKASPSRWSRRVLAGVSLVLVAGVVLGLGGILVALLSTPAELSHVPQLTSDEQQVAIDGINQQLQAFDSKNNASETNSGQGHAWNMILTQPQMQAWLQQNLPNEPSRAVPGLVANPRVYLREGHATLACEYNSKSVRSVVSLDLEPFAVPEVNQLGIHLRGARAGWVPVPLRKVLWRILLVANEMGLRIQVSDDSEIATARIFFPATQEGNLIEVQSCNVTKDGLVLAGVVRPVRTQVE